MVYGAVFPNKCLFCRKVLDNPTEITCADCEMAARVETKAPEGGCRIYAACDYSEAVRHAVFRYKYEGKRVLARPMAGLIFGRFGKIDADFLLPVPLHSKRIKERGFNQAALLAAELSGPMALPAYDGMVRTRDTAKQFELNPHQRAANVAGAFALKDGFCVEGRDVVLVDDILTTGATVAECVGVLKAGGAKSVSLIVFAVASL